MGLNVTPAAAPRLTEYLKKAEPFVRGEPDGLDPQGAGILRLDAE